MYPARAAKVHHNSACRALHISIADHEPDSRSLVRLIHKTTFKVDKGCATVQWNTVYKQSVVQQFATAIAPVAPHSIVCQAVCSTTVARHHNAWPNRYRHSVLHSSSVPTLIDLSHNSMYSARLSAHNFPNVLISIMLWHTKTPHLCTERSPTHMCTLKQYTISHFYNQCFSALGKHVHLVAKMWYQCVEKADAPTECTITRPMKISLHALQPGNVATHAPRGTSSDSMMQC